MLVGTINSRNCSANKKHSLRSNDVNLKRFASWLDPKLYSVMHPLIVS